MPDDLDETEYRSTLYPLYKAWIIAKALPFTQKRLQRFTEKVQEIPAQIQIKEQEQRWGSCTPDGKILLNWRIFLAPTSVVDYILVHELAHLKDLNHSADFWNTVKMLLPNYEDKKEWLRINGTKLYLSFSNCYRFDYHFTAFRSGLFAIVAAVRLFSILIFYCEFFRKIHLTPLI